MVFGAFTSTVTVVRQWVDTDGDPVDGDTHDVVGCFIWPGASTENTVNDDTVTWAYTVLMPYGSDILATDRVVCQGIVCDVIGQPASYESPLTGTRAGVEVRLSTATG